MAKPFVVWFDQVDKEDIPLVGGKGANLGEMTQAKIPVPQGFIVTAPAYFHFIKENSLAHKISEVMKMLDYNDPHSLNQTSLAVKKIILNAHLPKDLATTILKEYHELNSHAQNFEKKVFTKGGSPLKKVTTMLEEPLVAVRSSATAEDLPTASFAGQQATFLNVHGDVELLEKIKECYASLFEARAIFYREENKFDHFKVGIAVPVQKMVQSVNSGVMFTIDPITNAKTKITIEAVYGLGEMIVQGAVTPDHYEVDKKDLTILTKQIAKQQVMLSQEGRTTKERKVPASDVGKQKISDELIVEVAKIGKHLEHHYFFPQDIEWAIEDGKVYIVQTRPITTMHEEKAEVAPTLSAEDKKEVDTLMKHVALKGDPASPGLRSGPVKIVLKPSEIDKVKPGDVLVAPQTNPDYVPAMKKATAIITERGGRTCFSGDTNVLTTEGFMSMEELFTKSQQGQSFTILAYDYTSKKPAWKKVLSTQKNELNSITISVSQTGRVVDNSLDVTADHKFFTYDRRTLTKKPIKDILSTEEGVTLVDSLPVNQKDMTVSEKLAYLLGALATDGNVYLMMGKTKWRRGSVTFTQNTSEYKQEFIQTVNTYFTDIFHKTLTPREKVSHSNIRGRLITGVATDYRCFSLEIALKITELFTDLSLLATTFSEQTALSFLAGVLDGDGSFHNNRIQLYIGKKFVLESVIVSCLRLGIVPQVTKNRTIANVQIVERMDEIIALSHKIKQTPHKKILGTKLLAAKQILGDVIDEVNVKGRIKTYVTGNLYIDSQKIAENILPIASQSLKSELTEVLNSSLRMQRVRCTDTKGMIPVFNIEVEAQTELDHNYIVFTKNYTPLLVSNSHAAIVSRELGIPAVVGAAGATKKFANGTIVTVNGKTGEVYKGGLPKGAQIEVSQQTDTKAYPHANAKTVTRVYVNLAEPDRAEEMSKRHVDGIGLLRAEFILAQIGTHPKKFIKDGREDVFSNTLAENLRAFCESFSPRPVVYRLSDFKTNEYRNLKGGAEYEPHEENPMIGFRGAYRFIKDPNTLKLEVNAIKKVRNTWGLKNLNVMIPYVRTVDELEQVKKLMSGFGLSRSPSFKLWMMVEIPSNVILLEDFLKVGIDGVSIGSNDLTQLTLGTDRDNSELANVFNENNPAVLNSIEQVIKTCHKHGVTSSICGQAPSTYPELVEKLIRWGITSISVNPDVIDSVREKIYQTEKVLWHK